MAECAGMSLERGRPGSRCGLKARPPFVDCPRADMSFLRQGVAGRVPLLPFLRRLTNRAALGAGPGRTQGRHRPLLRPRRLYRARRGDGSRGRARPALAVSRSPALGARAIRRNRREVHRRRRDGGLRRAMAHEDDPERAVRAALAIRDWMAEETDMQVRIAVHTGEARRQPRRACRGRRVARGGGRRQHCGAHAGGCSGRRRARRRGHISSDPRRDSLPRVRAGAGEGQGGSGTRLERRGAHRTAGRRRHVPAHDPARRP